MAYITCNIKPYIQPFERVLALQELEALAGGSIEPLNGDNLTATTFAVSSTNDISKLQASLTYWHSIGEAENSLTEQVQREATQQIARSALYDTFSRDDVSDLISSSLPTSRSLRYATHGLHEYRGKFFPQLVRSLLNIGKVRDQATILDPMCGSGTTLVEACLGGHHSHGLDLNPLSVFISRVKCEALQLNPVLLSRSYRTLETTVLSPVQPQRLGRFASLADQDQTYLARWLSQETIVELDHIYASIDSVPMEFRDFYRVTLSNILRRVSWQKDDDLRVRKEKQLLPFRAVTNLFLENALRSAKTVGAFLTRWEHQTQGTYRVHEADARLAAGAFPGLVGQVDMVITSPPYATALPYIDTDRLSLVYLGLLPRQHHRLRDTLMIGNREITLGTREEYWRLYQEQASLLPSDTQSLIDRIDCLNKAASVGFRRKNLSAVLSKYFFDMRATIQQAFDMLRPKGTLFLVVGNNRTTAGQQSIEIRTAEHLMQIALGLGFKWISDTSMDMLVSRDIFRRNAVPSERILRIEKP